MQSFDIAHNTETRRVETRKAALDKGLRGFNRSAERIGTSDFCRKHLRFPAAASYNARIRASRPES